MGLFIETSVVNEVVLKVLKVICIPIVNLKKLSKFLLFLFIYFVLYFAVVVSSNIIKMTCMKSFPFVGVGGI